MKGYKIKPPFLYSINRLQFWKCEASHLQLKMFRKLFPVFLLPIWIAAFRNPFDKSVALPYGRQMRAMLSVDVPDVQEEPSDDLMWWHSLSRNNTIDCECGKFTSSNEVDSWESEGVESLNVYPWSVSLVAPGGVYAFCGGTLVNDRYVLTTASCVDGSNADGVDVLIGTWPNAHMNSMANEEDTDKLNITRLIRKKVHRVILHPQYLDGHLDYNIALLRLKGPVPTFGNKDGVSPVCLPSADSTFDEMKATSLLWRFEETDSFILPVRRSEVNSVVLSKSECKSYAFSKEWEIMPDTLMCSRMAKPTETHPYFATYDCPGDAGGPLLVTRGSQKVQIGIDSFTACYGRPRGVGVYTRITEFLPWIKLHTSLDGRLCSK